MKNLIVGNWKMNLGPGQGSILLHRLQKKILPHHAVEVVACPPAIDLHPLAKEIDKKRVVLGAQNMHYADHGAFTGEISPTMLKGLAKYVILGHSERRQHFGEDDKLIAQKMAAAYRNHLIPILCVGESLSDREHNLTNKVVVDQVSAALHQLTGEDMHNLIVAYEPVWAIGTGRFAMPEQVAPVAAIIRETVEELYGEEAGEGLRVLYGGSASPDNAAAYLRTDGIDGLLVGGASINYEQFAAIVKTAQDIADEAA